MDKFTILIERLDELIAETQKKFDRALAYHATLEDDAERECRESIMWAEIEYRDAKRMKEFILEAVQ
jgi:hypothetical protein